MKKIIIGILLMSMVNSVMAQNDYLVKTTNEPTKENQAFSEEENYIAQNFPLLKMCDWVPGMRFMVVPERIDMIIGTFKLYDTQKEVQNSMLKHKIFEFTGTEQDKNSLRFLFNNDGTQYYYELKYKTIEAYCQEKPKASIPTLAYLGDVDIARDLLTDTILYTRLGTARVDDANAFNGYKEVKIPQNTKVTVKEVGVGNKECPVKIVFEDSNKNSYYAEVALSKTNAGMDIMDYQGDKKYKYFPNAFSFQDANETTVAKLKVNYLNQVLYPKNPIEVKVVFSNDGKNSQGTIKLPRYTSLKINSIKTGKGNLITLGLADHQGNQYTKEVTFIYDGVVSTPNYFDDLFELGDLRSQYPNITETAWILISNGEIKDGMSQEEVRLSLGEPNLVRERGNSREFEDWVYPKRILSFEKGRLTLKN